jgi:radical SAM protein with 4Fe4S-binding SPASM domain
MTSPIVKTVNAMLTEYSFLASSFARKPLIYGMPVTVTAELTNNCNLRCPECASGSGMTNRERGFMDIELYKNLISELSPYLYYINLYFQGEPMMHPHFFSFPAITKGIKTVVSTNGHYLSPENSRVLVASGLKKLVISLDGMDQGTYSKYRINGDLGKVISGIRNVAVARDKYRSSLKLELQFLVNRNNEHQIHEARQLAREVKAHLKLKSMQVIFIQDAVKWMPERKRFRRYKEADGMYIIKSSLPNRCRRILYNPVITWDGKVIPCCFDKDAGFVMGDLKKDTFRKIWNNNDYNEFRKRVLTDRKSIGICRNCTSGLRGAKY